MAAGSQESGEEPSGSEGTLATGAVGTLATGAEATRARDRDAAVRDHLANERTLLAWQRTALAAIGLGFVVDRFALGGSSGALLGSLVGLGLICLGGLAALLGVQRYVRTSQQIDTDSYRPVLAVHIIVAGAIVIAAAALVVMLVVAPDAV